MPLEQTPIHQVQDAPQQQHVQTETQSSVAAMQPDVVQSLEPRPIEQQQPLQTGTAQRTIPVEEFLAQPIPAQAMASPPTTEQPAQQATSVADYDNRAPSTTTVSTRGSEADVFVDASEDLTTR
jgi:hypothetical protein